MWCALLLFSLGVVLVNSTQPVTVCFVMIADHPSSFLVDAAESFADFADDWVVVELGERQDSTELVDYLNSRGLKGSVARIDEADWSTNRMNAILAAFQLTPSEYIFFMDADWDFVPANIDFKKDLRRFEHLTYLVSVSMVDGSNFAYEAFYSTAVFWEDIDGLLSSRELYSTFWMTDVALVDNKYSKQDFLDSLREEADGLELKEDIDPSEVMSLGVAFYNLNEYELALPILNHRAEISLEANSSAIEVEEHFYASYLVGMCMDHLEQPFNEVVKQFVKTRSLLYHRVEPLLALVRLYRQSEAYLLSYAYAHAAAVLLSPTQHTESFQQKHGIYGRGVGLYGQHDSQSFTALEELAVSGALLQTDSSLQNTKGTVEFLLRNPKSQQLLSDSRTTVLHSIAEYAKQVRKAKIRVSQCQKDLLVTEGLLEVKRVKANKKFESLYAKLKEGCQQSENQLKLLQDAGRADIRSQYDDHYPPYNALK